MAALTRVGTTLAHGGLGGVVVETLVVVGVAAFFFAIWFRERRAGRKDES